MEQEKMFHGSSMAHSRANLQVASIVEHAGGKKELTLHTRGTVFLLEHSGPPISMS